MMTWGSYGELEREHCRSVLASCSSEFKRMTNLTHKKTPGMKNTVARTHTPIIIPFTFDEIPVSLNIEAQSYFAFKTRTCGTCLGRGSLDEGTVVFPRLNGSDCFQSDTAATVTMYVSPGIIPSIW